MTYTPPEPKPNGAARYNNAKQRRADAAEISATAVSTNINNEAKDFAEAWPTNFSKGLPHYPTGMVEPVAFQCFYSAINDPDFQFEVPLGPYQSAQNQDSSGNPQTPSGHRPKGYKEDAGTVQNFITDTTLKARSWESPLSGHVFDLEGPDAGSVGMAPAPRLGSDELVAEMAEDYVLALLRDTSFESMRKGQGNTQNVVDALNVLPWFNFSEVPKDYDGGAISGVSEKRRAARFAPGDTKLTTHSMFRGSTTGCMDGPYISQFLLVGNKSKIQETSTTVPPTPAKGSGYLLSNQVMVETYASGERKLKVAGIEDGYVAFGAQRVDQRVLAHKINLDYMTDWASWLDVQNGADLRGSDAYETSHLRFITTPRDLATYVHFDALYQAYLNACLMLLGTGAKHDAGFPEGGEHPTRAAFATFGGPHILTLVTESATRSLKAVRRQKYNYHLRARPEVMGAIATLSASPNASSLGPAQKHAERHLEELGKAQTDAFSILSEIDQHNQKQNTGAERNIVVPGGPDLSNGNFLLPMAFPEGSPMHPAYGAGHATVAGSCVTVLKAFFEMYKDDGGWEPLTLSEIGDGSFDAIYVPDEDGIELNYFDGNQASAEKSAMKLSLQGELNKLAANISIGRNMAGVHYYSDYFDSLRMGERVAVGMLLEQMVTYPEPLSMRFESFDDDKIVVAADGAGGASLTVNGSCDATEVDAWWQRHL